LIGAFNAIVVKTGKKGFLVVRQIFRGDKNINIVLAANLGKCYIV